MKTQQSSKLVITKFACVFLVGTAGLSQAAVIVPQTGSGAAIDPSGNSDVDAAATGSAMLSTVNGLAGRTTQVNWNGIGGTSGNTIDGDDVDVRIAHTVGSFSATASTLQNYNTGGGGNGYQWSGTNGQQLTISFGTQGGSFSNDRTVGAAGLVLLNFGGAYTDVTISYLDSSDAVLSIQSFAGAPDSQGGSFGGSDIFTGYISSSQNIAKLTVDITRNSGSSDIGLDAVTFVVPEPSGVTLLGFGLISLLGRRVRG
mgnify:FL=1